MFISTETLFLVDEFEDPDEDIRNKVLKVIEKIQTYVSSLEDPSPFDRTTLGGCWLGESEFILEWINGWGRAQFIFDWDSKEIVLVDNHEKKLIPKFTYLKLDMDDFPETIPDVARFIAKFSEGAEE